MKTVGLHIQLSSGAEEIYESAHQQMPSDVVEALRRAGIQNWKIFRDGRDLFHFIECEDYQQAMEQFLADPVGDRWQREMAILFDFTSSNDASRIRQPMQIIWSL